MVECVPRVAPLPYWGWLLLGDVFVFFLFALVQMNTQYRELNVEKNRNLPVCAGIQKWGAEATVAHGGQEAEPRVAMLVGLERAGGVCCAYVCIIDPFLLCT